MEFFRIFLMIPTILAVAGIIGGIVLIVFSKKNKKKIFMVSGILSFVITAACLLYIAGFLLVYIIGGSLFGEGSISPEYRSDYINEYKDEE